MKKYILIGAAIIFFMVIVCGGVVKAAPPQKATVYHRDGSVETFDNITYVKVASIDFMTYTSVIVISSNGVIYRFYNSEVVLEETSQNKTT